MPHVSALWRVYQVNLIEEKHGLVQLLLRRRRRASLQNSCNQSICYVKLLGKTQQISQGKRHVLPPASLQALMSGINAFDPLTCYLRCSSFCSICLVSSLSSSYLWDRSDIHYTLEKKAPLVSYTRQKHNHTRALVVERHGTCCHLDYSQCS